MQNEELLRLWKKYLNFEACAQSEIDLENINERQFLDSAAYGIENDRIWLRLDRELVQYLEEKYPLPEKGVVDENPLMLCLSPVKKHKKGREYAVPLFFAQITEKEEIYRACGRNGDSPSWTKCIQVGDPLEGVGVNVSFLGEMGLDSESFIRDKRGSFAENVSLLHTLKDVMGTNDNRFSLVYKRFRDFLKSKCEGQASLHFQVSDVLVTTIGANDFTKKWRDLYDLILKNPHLYNDSPLALEYLSGESQGNLEKINTLCSSPVWMGSFSDKFSLGRGQAIVMQRLQTDQRMIAAQGPPGTGKTTLFMSILANMMVNKACAIMEDKDFNSQMVIVSTANKAVENAAKEFDDSKEFAEANWIYLHAGSKERTGKSLSRVQALIEELKQTQFDKGRYKELENEIENFKNQILDKQKQCLELEKRLEGVNIDSLEKDRDKLAARVHEALEVISEYFDDSSLRGDGLEKIWKSHSDFAVYQEATQGLQEEHVRKILGVDEEDIDAAFSPLNNLSWFQSLILRRRKRMLKSIFNQLGELLAALGLNRTAMSYETAQEDIKRVLAKKKKALQIVPNRVWESYSLEYFKAASQSQSEMIHLEQRIKKYRDAERRLYDEFLGSFGEYERKKLVLENRRLYELAREFLYLTMVKNKREFTEALEKYSDILSGNNSRKVMKEIKSGLGIKRFLCLISTAYPVVTSTLFSVDNLFGAYFYEFDVGKGPQTVDNMQGQKPFYLVLSDETGMAKIHELLPLLCYSERFLSVGDPKQLKPVIPLDQNSCAAYENNFPSDAECIKYSPTTVSAYHRSAKALTGRYDDLGDSIILDEHRRCQPPIAEAFAEIAKYYGMSVETNPLDFEDDENRPFFKMGGKHFLLYDVLGEKEGRNANFGEAREVENVIGKLLDSGYNLSDIGVITPYRNQEFTIQQQLKNSSREAVKKIKKSQVGTIHKFQGVEYKAIIFSPVICRPEDNSTFINSEPNMLNVALSRAKELFIVVGNYLKMKASGGNLLTMCRHIEENGFIYEISPAHPLKAQGDGVIDDTCRHIEVLERALDQSQEEVIIVCPWLRNPQGNQSRNLLFIKQAKQKGVRVRVFYGYLGAESNDPGEDSDPKFISSLSYLLNSDLVKLKAGTHEKILIVDRKQMFVGSFNWLSNQYKDYCRHYDKGRIRRETSIRIDDQDKINRYIESLGSGLM